MSFISVNFHIIGDSYIDSEGIAHRLKDVVSVDFDVGVFRNYLSVNSPHGRHSVIPTSTEAFENNGEVPTLHGELMDAAREEFLELVHLASDPRLPLQEGVNLRSGCVKDEQPSALEGFL